MRCALLVGAVLSVGLLGGCCPHRGDGHKHHGHDAKMSTAANLMEAVAVIAPTKGNKAAGTVRFTQEGNSVKVVANITGLKPGAKHGFHVHAGTECGEDGMKAGDHYNPEGHKHGLPDQAQRHAGDLGNLQADRDGKAHFELTVENITINGAKNPILGHALIVHADPDDGGQPLGNAGARIGCGIVKAGEKR